MSDTQTHTHTHTPSISLLLCPHLCVRMGGVCVREPMLPSLLLCSKAFCPLLATGENCFAKDQVCMRISLSFPSPSPLLLSLCSIPLFSSLSALTSSPYSSDGGHTHQEKTVCPFLSLPFLSLSFCDSFIPSFVTYSLILRSRLRHHPFFFPPVLCHRRGWTDEIG